MCAEKVIKMIIAAIVIAVGLWVLVSAFLMQLAFGNITYTQNTLEIIARYLAGIILVGGTKIFLLHEMFGFGKMHGMKKPARKRR